MRTLLLWSLLALSFGFTFLSLLAVHFTLERQVHRDVNSDLQHTLATFLNLENQRREMLARETGLLGDLPSLKALMTTEDARTICDGGKEFWTISGSDLFQLYDRSGNLVASYGLGQNAMGVPMHDSLRVAGLGQDHGQRARTLASGSRLYELAARSLSFGSRTDGTLLGYVVLGSEINDRMAREVSQATSAEVAFTIDGMIAASTLKLDIRDAHSGNRLSNLVFGTVQNVTIGPTLYLAAVAPLGSAAPTSIQLVVLRSYSEITRVETSLNSWFVGLGMLALVFGSLLAVSISRRVTKPLEALVDGARAMGRGDFKYQLPDGGTTEIRELTTAFDHMRVDLETSQRALVDSERLATIGRMANSISHDLRHYMSAMYANAEFLSLSTTQQSEREELIFEVKLAVDGMTDLLDSLLSFSRTGKALNLSYESFPYLIERAAALLRAHPEAGSLKLNCSDLTAVEAWVDATKFVRAVFNLLLNACQAANRGVNSPCVTLELTESATDIVIRVIDNGEGVPPSLVATMFEPFVSLGRENGTGLGLTLTQHIAQEHGGSVCLEESAPGRTVFLMKFTKQALRSLIEPDHESNNSSATFSHEVPDAQRAL